MSARGKAPTGFRSAMEKDAWDKVKDLPEFRWPDLERAGFVEATAKDFVRRWVKAGRVREMRKADLLKYYVNAERPVEAPVLPAETRSAEDAMWTIMRRAKVFTPTDIAAHVNAAGFEVTVERARGYCRQLLGAGYLKVRQKAVSGKREAAYQLVNDTGLSAPRPTRVTGLLDQNTGTFIPASEDLR